MISGNFARRIGMFVLGGWVATGQCLADDPTPKPIPASKYAKMAAHSPFAPPTAAIAAAPAPTPPPAPGWADSLTVSMIMQNGPKYMVTVIDSNNPQQHLYVTSEPDPSADPSNQMVVASVKWGQDRDDPPTITLRKGREFAQVRYDSGAAPSKGPGGPGNAPAIPGGPRNLAMGAMGIRPPPLPNPAAGNPGGLPANAIRRPVIRSQPAPGRPAANQPSVGARPRPGAQLDDDDDDD